VQALEAEIVKRLREFILAPQVSISLVQFRSEPVFLVGAFRAPGIYPLQGRRTLIEMLSSVGGLQPNASRRIRVTRRADYGPIDLPNAVVNPEKKISTVEISLESLTQNVNPEEDLVLQSYDIVSAERAERVYVSGNVTKVGAIELSERDSISVAQAITEAGGFTSFAVRDKVRVLRPILGTSRRAEIIIDLNRVFEGKDVDFPLLPNDVLFVPKSSFKGVTGPVGVAMLGTLPYLIITALLR
jgi:polysaccharide export outer membrane protein